MCKVVIGDVQEIFRAGLRESLNRHLNLRIVAQCANRLQLYREIPRHADSLIIVSTRLVSDPEGLVRAAMNVNSRVLLIADDLECLALYRSSGAIGVLTRGSREEDFIECVRRIGNEIQFATPFDFYRNQDPRGYQIALTLNKRERRVLAYVLEGMGNRQIAENLGTTVQVIKNTRGQLYIKTGMEDRLDLALFALRHPALNALAADTLVLTADTKSVAA